MPPEESIEEVKVNFLSRQLEDLIRKMDETQRAVNEIKLALANNEARYVSRAEFEKFEEKVDERFKWTSRTLGGAGVLFVVWLIEYAIQHWR